MQTISIEQALALRDRGALFVDARSPAEYAEGTIPGAVNIPIFDDAERARVGILYKEAGKTKAKRLGVELVAPKIPGLIDQVEAAMDGKKTPVLVFCWRGGMRSFALATFFDLAGIPTMQVEGGHKAFRAVVRDFFAYGEWGRLLVLRGLTGVGKTRLLKKLQEEGYPMVDLEGIANHRGSAFGNLGLAPQPSQTYFEALLWDEMRRIPADGYALAEGESKHIGRLILPARVYAALQVETSLWIEAPIETRVRITLDDYPARDELKEAFLRPLALIRPRLGGENHDRLLGYLEQGRWDDLSRELMLLYYDPLYRHTCPERRICVTMADAEPDLTELKGAIARILAESPTQRSRGPIGGTSAVADRR